jgi:capsule polysaccharide export protein KpsC/LpsZ
VQIERKDFQANPLAVMQLVDAATSGHGSWSLKGFHAQIAGQSVFVAGLPHLSRYSPIGKQHVVTWLKNESRV